MMAEENKELVDKKQPNADQLLLLTNDLINAFHQTQLLLKEESEQRSLTEEKLANTENNLFVAEQKLVETQYKLSVAEQKLFTAEKKLDGYERQIKFNGRKTIYSRHAFKWSKRCRS